MKERLKIFKNAALVAIVKKKGNTPLKYWHNYVAILSNSYIYFYPVKESDLINEAMLYFHKDWGSNADQNLKSPLEEKGAENKKRRFTKVLSNRFNTLNYEEYFLVKGC